MSRRRLDALDFDAARIWQESALQRINDLLNGAGPVDVEKLNELRLEFRSASELRVDYIDGLVEKARARSPKVA